jgi:phasin family protein
MGRVGHARCCLGARHSVKRGAESVLLCNAQKILETYAAVHYCALQQRSSDVADETKIEEKIEAAAKAAPASAKAVADQAKAAAPAVVNTPVIETKPIAKAKKTVRRARKAPAKVVEAVKKVNKRAAKSAGRARKAAPVGRVNKIEGTKIMTYDFNQLFAGFQIPGADKYQQFVSEAGERSQQLAAKSQKAAEDFSDLAKANVEAIVEAGRIAAGGVKALGQDVIASGREGIEQASDAVKTLAEAKSPAEFFQIQSELARASFDRFVAETSKLTERVVKLAGETAEPLQNRASLNAERINTLVA